MCKGMEFTACAALAAACLAATSPAFAGTVTIDQIAPAQTSAWIAQASGSGQDAADAVQPDTAAPLEGFDRTDTPTVLDTDLRTVQQDDTLGARALVEQKGPGETSLIVQSSLDGGRLFAEVHQSAPDAYSEIFQSGALNTAVVFQTISAGAFSSIRRPVRNRSNL